MSNEIEAKYGKMINAILTAMETQGNDIVIKSLPDGGHKVIVYGNAKRIY